MNRTIGWVLGETRWWALVSILAALPLLLVFWTLDQQWQQTWLQARESDRQSIELVRRCFSCDSVSQRVGEHLRYIVDTVRSSSQPIACLQTASTNLKKKFPETFEFLVFDRQGCIVPGFDSFPEWSPLLASLGVDLACFHQGDGKPLKAHFPKYTPIFGSFLLGGYEMSVISGTYLRSFRPRRQFIFHSGIIFGQSDKLIVVVLISVTKRFPFLGLQLFRENMMERFPGLVAEVIDLEQPLGKWRLPRFVNRYDVRRELLERGVDDSQSWFAHGRVWKKVTLKQRYHLLFSLQETGFEGYCRVRERCGTGLTILWAVLLMSLAGARRFLDGITLRLRLLALFLYTTVIPLLLLGYTAMGLMQDRRENLQRKAFSENGQILDEMARTGLELLGDFERTCLDLSVRGKTGDPSDLAEVVKRFEQLGKKAGVTAGVLIDENQKLLSESVPSYTGRSGMSFEGMFKTIFPVLASQLAQNMAVFNHVDRPPRETAREQALKATLESNGLDADRFLSFLDETIGTIYGIEFSDEITKWLGFYCYDLQKRVPYAGILLWNRGELAKLVDQAWRRFGERLPGWWLGTRESVQSYDNHSPFAEPARRWLSRLAEDRVLQHAVVAKATESFLLSGNWADTVVPVCMFLARPEAPISHGVQKTLHGLLLVALVLLASGVLIGLLLSRSLLHPVRNLGNGMEAVRRRDFRFRIPVQSRDELGQLSETFNLVMDQLADLEVAKVVQETFFPPEPLRGQGWEVAGSCRTACRVGGDYFDFFALPDGRWLILIGDVAGHGTAAALVVAIAKSVVCHPDTPPEPQKILEILNDQLVHTMSRRRMMTCFVAIFDPCTGILQASNAGHNYPFLVRDGQASEIEIEHLLLGTRMRQPFPLHQLTISTSDFICFYSDGLIETVDWQGNAIGYDRAKKSLSHLRQGSAPATVEAILAWRAGLAGSTTLEDDVTVMVLQSSGPWGGEKV